MITSIENLLLNLQILSKELGISIVQLNHEPLGGHYLGHIRFKGDKGRYKIQISIDLDFPLENDGIILHIDYTNNNLENGIKGIKSRIAQIKKNFNIPMQHNWENIISKEIKIQTDFYN